MIQKQIRTNFPIKNKNQEGKKREYTFSLTTKPTGQFYFERMDIFEGPGPVFYQPNIYFQMFNNYTHIYKLGGHALVLPRLNVVPSLNRMHPLHEQHVAPPYVFVVHDKQNNQLCMTIIQSRQCSISFKLLTKNMYIIYEQIFYYLI